MHLRRFNRLVVRPLWCFLIAALALLASLNGRAATLLNVSYDPTRELYEDINKEFSSAWQKQTGETITIRQSHGGSGKQARSVIDGLDADVVTLALAYDIDAIAEKGRLLDRNWQKRLPSNSCPFTSTIVFLVRKGNPKGIKDWDDLAKPNVAVVTPNPKTSGGARWNYLAAYGYALKKNGNDSQKAKEFVGKIYKNVSVLDSGARGATVTFLQRGIGDVLIAWENEALLAREQMSRDPVEIIYPSISILAEPPVAMVDRNVKRHKTEKAATEYLKFLYTKTGQEIGARHYYRPSDPQILEKEKAKFPPITMLRVEETFGGWAEAQKTHFGNGGTFDQIYAAGK
jgi:sulfate/thiosulfate-binding protein